MTKELSPLQRSFKRINELLPDSDRSTTTLLIYTTMCTELTNKSFAEGINTKY